MINDIKNSEDLNTLLGISRERPVFVFKHSTVCPISRSALESFSKFAESNSKPDYWRVLVRENRDLSTMIADQTGIEHESPQVILFYGGKAVWSCSHHTITHANLNKQLKQLNK